MLELLGAFCLFLAWLVPNHYPPWTSFYNESLAAVALALFTASIGARLLTSRFPDVAWIVLATAAIPLIQWCFGLVHFSGDAWIASLYLIGLAVAIATGYLRYQANSGEAAALLGAAALAAGLVSSVLALTQVMQIGLGIWAVEVGPSLRPGANLGQSNNLSTLIGFALAGLLLLREQRRLSATISLLALSVLLVGLSFAQSRTALMFGPLTAGVIWIARRNAATFHTRLRVVAGATLVQWALAAFEPKVLDLFLLSADPLQSITARGVGSLRFQIWPMLLSALHESPWQGFGWLQVGAAQLSVVDRFPPVGELWLHGHNVFLELLVWCGYPLGGLLCVLLAYWFVSRCVGIRTVEAATAAIAISFFAVHALLELPHHYAYFLIPIGLWAGMVEHEAAHQPRVTAKWNLLPVAFGIVLWLSISAQYFEVEEDFRQMRFETMRIGSMHTGARSPNAPLLSGLTEFLELTRTPVRKGMTAAQLDRLEQVVKRYPYTLPLTRFAAACALNGRQSDASRAFLQLRNLYGEPTYLAMKRVLHEWAEAGPRELQELEQSLPSH